MEEQEEFIGIQSWKGKNYSLSSSIGAVQLWILWWNPSTVAIPITFGSKTLAQPRRSTNKADPQPFQEAPTQSSLTAWSLALRGLAIAMP